MAGLGAIAGGITFASLARSAVDAADSVTLLQSKLRLVTSGSEGLAKVQNQVVNLARQTRTDFSSVGELYARIARSSKQLGVEQSDVLRVTKAVSQAIQISGNTAVEASAGMIQLAQALASGVLRGDELRSVLEQMPRVAEAIAAGLGTTVGQLRRLGEEGKLTSELVFKALISQAGALNSEFNKLKPTVSQTLGVLIGDLKLATAEFLNVTGTTDRLTESIGGLSKAIRGMSTVFQTGFAAMNSYWERFNKWLDESDKNLAKFLGVDGKKLERITRQAEAAVLSGINPALGRFYSLATADDGEPRRRTRGPTGAQRGRGRQEAPLLPVATARIEEFRVTAQRIRDEYGDVLREIEESTRTSVERQSAEYLKLKTNLEFLLDEKLISKETFDKRLGTALDELLPEFDLNEIRAKYKTLKKETTEIGEFMKGVWQQVGRSIQSTLSDALYEWKFSWKSLLDIARRALADITAAIITSGIKDALKNAAAAGNSGGSSGGGFNWFQAFASFFGKAAGGGRTDRPTIVGEDGPEIVMGSNRVMNMRQMAFAGGGGINFAPVNNFTIVERDNPDQTKQEMVQYFETRSAQQQAEFVRVLQRSGYEVRG